MTPRPMSKAWVCSSTVCYRQRFLGLAGAGGDVRAAPLGVSTTPDRRVGCALRVVEGLEGRPCCRHTGHICSVVKTPLYCR